MRIARTITCIAERLQSGAAEIFANRAQEVAVVGGTTAPAVLHVFAEERLPSIVQRYRRTNRPERAGNGTPVSGEFVSGSTARVAHRWIPSTHQEGTAPSFTHLGRVART